MAEFVARVHRIEEVRFDFDAPTSYEQHEEADALSARAEAARFAEQNLLKGDGYIEEVREA